MYTFKIIKKNYVKTAFVKKKIMKHEHFFNVCFIIITSLIMEEWNGETIKFLTNNQFLTVN